MFGKKRRTKSLCRLAKLRHRDKRRQAGGLFKIFFLVGLKNYVTEIKETGRLSVLRFCFCRLEKLRHRDKRERQAVSFKTVFVFFSFSTIILTAPPPPVVFVSFFVFFFFAAKLHTTHYTCPAAREDT